MSFVFSTDGHLEGRVTDLTSEGISRETAVAA